MSQCAHARLILLVESLPRLTPGKQSNMLTRRGGKLSVCCSSERRQQYYCDDGPRGEGVTLPTIMTGLRAKRGRHSLMQPHGTQNKLFFSPCPAAASVFFLFSFSFETETVIDRSYYEDNGKRNTKVVVASKPGGSEHKSLAGTTTLQGQETDVKNTSLLQKETVPFLGGAATTVRCLRGMDYRERGQKQNIDSTFYPPTSLETVFIYFVNVSHPFCGRPCVQLPGRACML